MHNPIIGGSRRNPLPEQSSPNLKKPVKEPQNVGHNAIQHSPRLLPEKTGLEPASETPAALPLPDETVETGQGRQEEVRKPVTSSVPTYSNPLRAAWEDRIRQLIKQWRKNDRHCPLCNRYFLTGINGHLSKCLPFSKFSSELQATTSTDPTTETR